MGNRLRAATAAALATVLLAGCSQTTTDVAVSSGPACKRLPSATGTALKATVRAGAPGAIALVDARGARRCGAAGYSDLDEETPMRAGDRWIVASVTKPFVAAVVLQLIQEERLSLDTPVSDVLPGLAKRGDEITVEHLLRHTSGLADYYDTDAFDRLVDKRGLRVVVRPIEMARMGAALPLQFSPGRGYEYSNTNWIVLGLIVEKVTGRTLEQQLRTRIFTPLELSDTRFEAYRRPRGPLAHGYELEGNGLLEDPGDGYADVEAIGPSIVLGWADGAIVSSADDLVTFYRALLRGDLLDEATQSRLMTFDRNDSGLGFFRAESSCGYVYGHDGSTSGYETGVFGSRDGSRVSVVMANASDDDTVSAALERLGDRLYCGAR